MKQPPITTKQQEILKLLYRFRFVDRTQIQAFLQHKDKGRVSAWLKDLREKQYIGWIYSTDFYEKAKPAIYYLEINGVRHLRSLDEFPDEELNKRYKESTRSQAFIEKCVLIADCCVNMETRTADASNNVRYTYVTEADYLNPDNEYNFLNESEFIHPHLCYIKEQGTEDDFETTNNLLEVFDATLPRYSLKKRLRGYVSFLDSDEWEEGSEIEDDELPVILLVCHTKDELIYAKRYTKKELKETYGDEDDDIPNNVRIRVTTLEQIKEHGLTGKAWEKVTKH